MEVYFDNSATTPLCEAAKEALIKNIGIYGNPSSLHNKGFEAEQLVTDARKKIASTLRCTKEEIFFTSCGSEANNLAIIGGCMAKIRRGNRIITTDSEHPSVNEAIKRLCENGFEAVYLSTKGGMIDMAQLEDALNDKTVMVSVMHTNNETGAVYPINEISRLVRKISPEALIHCDFVQGYLKTAEIPDADLISVSAHKIHAPKGVGALYKKRGVRILPQLLGGGQETGLRSGTENTLSISAFGEAAEYFHKNLAEDIKKTASLREYLVSRLSALDGVSFNTPEKCAPNIISVAFDGIKSEVMLHFLSEYGIYVSSGSACSSKKGKSGVLAAFGAEKNADFTVRISLSPYNTAQQADYFCDTVKNAMQRLQKVRR